MKTIDTLSRLRDKLCRRLVLISIRRRGNMSDFKARSLLDQLFADIEHETDNTGAPARPVSITITNMTGNINILCRATPGDHNEAPEPSR